MARQGSALRRVAASAWAGAVSGYRETAPRARRRFLVRLALALALVTAASGISALALQEVAVDGRLPGDGPADAWLRPLLSVHSALWIAAFTSSSMITPLLVLAAVLAARVGYWERAVVAIVSYVASKAIILTGWTMWDRARPADVADGVLIPEGLSSYPSGHAVQALTVYGVFVVWWSRATDRWWERALAWAALLAGTLAIGVGRIAMGAHHPSDVLGGMLLGALWVVGAAWAEPPRPQRARSGSRESA